MEDEKNFYDDIKSEKNAQNPWERVLKNVELKDGDYVGGCDVSRMRASMMARKTDITKGVSKGLL